MRNVMRGSIGAIAAIGLAACTGATATSDPQTQSQAQSATPAEGSGGEGKHPPPRHHHGPPPEALEACRSKAVGDACTVTFGKESLAGKCVTPPAPPSGAPDGASAPVVCRPDKMPEHGPGGGPGGRPHGPPPEEVFAACDGKAADAACSVTLGDHTIEGTCRAAPPTMNETRLGCAPSRQPPGEGPRPQR